jgi:glycine cleavage system H protein
MRLKKKWEAKMSLIPDDLRYTEHHEWIQMTEDYIVIMGITDYAQEQLSDIVFVELPERDVEVKQGEQIAVVESVKAISDIFSPVSGRIVEVNREIEDSPELINSDPYGDGWICKIDIKDTNEFYDLMDADEYSERVEL